MESDPAQQDVRPGQMFEEVEVTVQHTSLRVGPRPAGLGDKSNPGVFWNT